MQQQGRISLLFLVEIVDVAAVPVVVGVVAPVAIAAKVVLLTLGAVVILVVHVDITEEHTVVTV